MTYVIFPEDMRAHLVLGFRSVALLPSKADARPSLSIAWTLSGTAGVVELQQADRRLYDDISYNPQRYTVITYQEPQSVKSIIIFGRFNEVAESIAGAPFITVTEEEIVVPSGFIERAL